MDEVETVSRANTVLKETQVYPLEVAKDKLLKLEKNIERRYLKPPFSKRYVVFSNFQFTVINSYRK